MKAKTGIIEMKTSRRDVDKDPFLTDTVQRNVASEGETSFHINGTLKTQSDKKK